MYNQGFRLSYSSLKQFEDPKVCLEEWKKVYVTRTSSFPSNIKMDYGSYFEYLCIGSAAKSGDEITDLPRKKNGEKYVAQERIELQAERFKEMMEFFGEGYLWLSIEELQKRLEFKSQVGIIDFIATDPMQMDTVLCDLKLTADVNATGHPAMFGHDENIDITQAVHYCWLYEQLNGFRPRFKYIVFDYSPRMGHKVLTIEVGDNDILLLNGRKQKVFDFVHSNNPEDDWSIHNSRFNKMLTTED